MTTTATVLLVFGRGVVAGDDGYRLTAESVARTEAAVAYVRAHAEAFRRTPGARVVFTGGWPHGLLGAAEFTAQRPLGLVSHPWHLPRVRLLAARVLGLSGPALADVPVTAPDPVPVRRERAARAFSRIGFLGVRTPEASLRRERALTRAADRIGRLTPRR
ncbi:YdcF family protein [Micromonospora sp. HUAS YX12]|uniref:YdcF family protein n=1 Tax=Micromonospora sp. HUAS YX12 TaxID=3156396 RepID=A0AAU7QX95_9ACTN